MVAIEVRDLTKSFVRKASRRSLRRETTVVEAVRSVSFSVEAGEMVGYIGPNGAGKSTTIKMLTGILTPTSGTVLVSGLDPSRQRRELARRMGVVFGQRSTLWWDLPLADSFDTLRRMYDVNPARHRANLAAFTDLLNLGPLLRTPVRQLSLGQRMRGELTAAFLHDPEIVYLDEPTIGLDIVSKAAVRDFLADVNRTRGTTVLLTTHDLDDIERLCPRVILIDGGRVVHDGSISALTALSGHRRLLRVDFATAHPPLTVPGTTFSKADGPRQWLEINADATVPAVVAAVMTVADVVDLGIEDPDIEDVISDLYSAG